MVRFTLAVTLATAAESVFRIPNGYWIPLTVCLILRPEFAVTVHRGITRIAGTLVGVSVAFLIMRTIQPTGFLLDGMLILTAWLSYALFLTNYAVFSSVITLYILLSLSVAGGPQQIIETGTHRLLATLLGGSIALGSYLMWPTWQAVHVGEVLWEAVTAQLEYAQGLASVLEGGVEERVNECRGHARRWRLRADDLLQASLVEPHWPNDLSKGRARSLLETLNANAAALLAMQAQLQVKQPGRVGLLRRQLAELIAATEALRTELGQLPSVQAEHR
ncbi:FUSC family protein (plasmid) [Deinococcus sp. KNUC1210]|uniref:FUSC family protein n=1 Tax=Deinococcus sp. KNUC1210 TaxID=2917691 RepID=UPI001EF10194|nr:FUSC family protein [Deinococcus sp. KNUC1210]ULH17931.1 FUSC family protein [Deinococcus sp. KNUC1210]